MKKIIMLKIYESWDIDETIYSKLPEDTTWVNMSDEDFEQLQKYVRIVNNKPKSSYEKYIIVEYNSICSKDKDGEQYASVADLMEQERKKEEEQKLKKFEQERLKAEQALKKKLEQYEKLKQELETDK